MADNSLKVLLIEDDLVDQQAFKRMVKEENLAYEYTIASSVKEAREILNIKGFQVVIGDLSLGDGTLFDILDQLVAKEIPVIVTTGTGDESTAVKAIKGGADDYIIKDRYRHYLQILATTVEKTLKNKKALAERKLAQEALRESEEKFRGIAEEIRLREERQRLQEQAARVSRLMSISAMSAGVIHEIGQPLNAIRLLTDGMLYWHKKGYHGDTDKLFTNLERISAQVNRIDEIIEHMRLFTRVGTSTEVVTCKLNDIINQVLGLLGRQLSAHGITVTKALEEQLPSIMGDRIALEEMLVNLVVNAMQALDTVKHVNKEISFATWKEKGWAAIEISDNAAGIPNQLKDEIFQPFFTTKQESGGTGLGLAIVRSVVENHQGKITVGNNERGGATFRVELPFISK